DSCPRRFTPPGNAVRGYFGRFTDLQGDFVGWHYTNAVCLTGDGLAENESPHIKIAMFSELFACLNYRTIELEEFMTKQNNDAMPAKSIRLTTEQWEACDRLYKQRGLPSRNDFIRDAVDFYIAWQSRESVERFLTPALESVIGGKIRDTEERLARILFKLAVDQNFLAHMIGDGYQYDEEYLEQRRIDSIGEVKRTNGTLTAKDILDSDDGWQD
ncbi:MAG: hypothetical protein IJF67_16465, partial [Clostridia bacterium]|nr:hypothetical protein [Clostridia bacterium]